MTLPSSGALSMQAINAEFGRGNNLNSYRGTVWYTDAGSSGTFSSGAISFSEFYSKRLTSPTFSFTISTNQTNANLRTLAVNAGWNQSSKVVATINSGVYISANSTGTPALTVNGSFPGGVELVNNGFIVGMGGAGGVGGGVNSSGGGIAGSAGSSGGLALSVSAGISINNASGTIAGGGGGGGGGSSAKFTDGKGTLIVGMAGGGGGGGRSSAAANSAGGSRGTSYGTNSAGNGGAGTVSSAGGGGNGYSLYSVPSGAGGGGGGWGSSGVSGSQGGTPVAGPYGGGGGGGAVSGNGNITWVATGTRLGSIA